MTPSPTPSPSATAVATVSNLVQLAPEQWQFFAVALVLVVFCVGVWLTVNI